MPDTTIGLATSFITFSRPGASGGGATVTDRDGKIKWAGHNLLTNSESFDASAWGKYLTTVTANSTVAPNGTTTADTIATTSSNATIYQSSVIPVGTSTFSCWFKAGTLTSVKVIFDGGAGTGREATFTLSGSGTAGAVANSGSGAGTLSGGTSSITPLSDGWYLCTIAGVTTTAAAGLTLLLATSGNVIAWGAHLYRSDLGGMQQNPAMGAGMGSYYPTTPRNLLGYTEDFSAAYWVKNGSAVSSNVVLAPNGLQTADKITENTASSNHAAYTSAAVLASPYTFSVYLKAAERSWVYLRLGLGAYFNLSTGAKGTVDAGVTADIVSVGDGWYRCWIRVTTSAGTEYPTVFLASANGTNSYTGDGTSGIYLWGAQLSDSASLDAYVPQYGAAVTSAAYYAPRLDFDPVTLAARGLLVEEARTNLLLQSNNFSTSWISGGGATVTSIATPAPDGINSSQKLQEAAATAAFSLAQSPTMSASTAYTLSVYMKAAERSFGVLNIYTGAASCWTWYNLSTGVVSTLGSGASATITSAGNGWYRCTITIATAASGTPNVGIWPSNANGVLSYAGTAGSGIYLYGAQLEAGSFATSYIPNGSAVAGATRAADVASVSTGAFPYSATEGTVVANGTFFGLNKGASDGLVALTNGTAAENIALFRTGSGNNIQFSMRDNSSDQAVYIVAMGSQPIKAAFAYAENNSNAALNGTAQTTDTTCTLPTVNEMLIGSIYAKGDYPTNGWIRQITYIPRRLSNAELASRTAA